MAGGLFHYKHDPSPDRAYSIKKEDYPRLPLFDPNAPAPKRRYLNEVFLLVLDNIPTWRSMSATYAVDSDSCITFRTSMYGDPKIIQDPRLLHCRTYGYDPLLSRQL